MAFMNDGEYKETTNIPITNFQRNAIIAVLKTPHRSIHFLRKSSKQYFW